MSRYHSYISSAKRIIESYDGKKPLMFHLKSFFAAEKKYGSRDRKLITSLCYGYFRLGHALKDISIEERILIGLFLTEDKENAMLEFLNPARNKQVFLNLNEKLKIVNLDPLTIFPFLESLTDEFDKTKFAISFLKQPDLFIRARPGKEEKVTAKLEAALVPFKKESKACFRLANNTSLDNIVRINNEAVIQDQNSQQVFNFLLKEPDYFLKAKKLSMWDCCAASGGKSILLYDILGGNIKITVSDIRENILANLEKRLGDAGVNIYKKFMADLSNPFSKEQGENFPIIICDAPCTGSGTWGRTPESLFFFRKELIVPFAERQKKIVSNVVPQLEKGGLFFYITCSVFKEENEEIVQYITKQTGIKVLHQEYLEGYEQKADNLFVAVFTN